MNNIYEFILENDLNPFMIFSSSGKLNNFNKEAEFLFNFVSVKELYELAIQNASKTFGYEKKFINIKYKKQSFYAILVAYINDDEIALRLYKEVSPAKNISIGKSYQVSNIFILINLSKNTSFNSENIKLEEVFDSSIPEFKIDINKFLLTLNHIFSSLDDQKNLKLLVHLKAGEYEIINDKKYHIISVEFKTDTKIDLDELNFDNGSTINIYQKNNLVEIELPLIL